MRLTGPCPRCDGRGGGDDFFPCPRCNDERFIRYVPFGPADDEVLRRLVLEGRPWPHIALELDRPKTVVEDRAREIGLESTRPLAAPAIQIRTRDGRAIQVDDPAFDPAPSPRREET